MSKKSLNKKMDKLLLLEQSGQLKASNQSRIIRKMKASPLAVAGILIFGIIVILCAFAPLFTKFSATAIHLKDKLSAPNSVYILGTDQLGRDIWARILYGGRLSIIVGLGSALGSALIGVSLGVYAGYKGGWLDSTILKFSEIFMAFPQIVLVLIIVAITKASLLNLILIFVATGWPSMYRMTRSQILSIKEQEYVQALRAFGVNEFKICFK
ncbi:MAG: ABC transporter permease, partial [Clostridia bacterium]